MLSTASSKITRLIIILKKTLLVAKKLSSQSTGSQAATILGFMAPTISEAILETYDYN